MGLIAKLRNQVTKTAQEKTTANLLSKVLTDTDSNLNDIVVNDGIARGNLTQSLSALCRPR